MSKVTITTANGCAWRAVYLRVGDRQVFHAGVDPNDGTRPVFFASVAGLGSIRVGLPYVPWAWASRTGYAAPVMLAYRLSSRFWHRVDGRYRGGK